MNTSVSRRVKQATLAKVLAVIVAMLWGHLPVLKAQTVQVPGECIIRARAPPPGLQVFFQKTALQVQLNWS